MKKKTRQPTVSDITNLFKTSTAEYIFIHTGKKHTIISLYGIPVFKSKIINKKKAYEEKETRTKEDSETKAM